MEASLLSHSCFRFWLRRALYRCFSIADGDHEDEGLTLDITLALVWMERNGGDDTLDILSKAEDWVIAGKIAGAIKHHVLKIVDIPTVIFRLNLRIFVTMRAPAFPDSSPHVLVTHSFGYLGDLGFQWRRFHVA